MITTEQKEQAHALQTGLALAGRKNAPIAAVSVDSFDGKYRFCQYPDSFCLFKRQGDRWVYDSCTCKMQFADDRILQQADQIVRFPDFYDRLVYFAFYGDRVGLFINLCFKGFLASDPPLIDPDDDDSITLDCIYIHGDMEPVPDNTPASVPDITPTCEWDHSAS